MPGINDSTLVHGVLDLIQRSLRKNTDGDPWEGSPSVILNRDNPEDEWVLTSALLIYPSGHEIFIDLNRGMTDEEVNEAMKRNELNLPPVWVESDPSGETLDTYSLLSAHEQQGITTPQLLELGKDMLKGYSITPVLPEGMHPKHFDFEYYKKWRLKNVLIEKRDPNSVVLEGIIYHMVYDYKSRLTAAIVERI